jgi:hypothetical protein
MKANKRRFLCRPIALSLVLSVLSFSTAQAAEGVRWVDLPKKIGRGKIRSDDREDRQYRVVTKDGLTQVGHKLIFSPTDVRLTDSGPSIPREQVVEIRIHRDRRISDALLAPGSAVFLAAVGKDEYWIFSWRVLLVPVLVPVTLGVVAAAAPVSLSVEAIRRRLPDKVVRVAH